MMKMSFSFPTTTSNLPFFFLSFLLLSTTNNLLLRGVQSAPHADDEGLQHKDELNLEKVEEVDTDPLSIDEGHFSRISRSPPHAPDFLPPVLKSRVQGRSSKFHEGSSMSRPGTGGNPYGSPVARMLISRHEVQQPSVSIGGESETDEAGPTFTPLISPSVFNMEQFLANLKDNLNSMTQEGGEPTDFGHLYDEIEYEDGADGNGDQGGDSFKFDVPLQSLNHQQDAKGLLRWLPPSFVGSRSRNRHILHFLQPQDSNLDSVFKPHKAPARNAYEFGLG